MKLYERYFENFDIYDCIVGRNVVCLLARESGKSLSEITNQRVVLDYINTEFGESAGYANLKYMTDMKGCLANKPEPDFVFVSSNGQVYKWGWEGENEVQRFESDIEERTYRVTNVKRVCEKAYAVTVGREVFRRDSADTWNNISTDISSDKVLQEEVYKKGGFNDIDGFSEKDMYAVGDDGDCWHYNGESWSRIDIPTNVNLTSVHCASDGFAYIGGMLETVIKGRNVKWSILTTANTEYSIRKIVGFQNKIYISISYGLFEIIDHKLQEVDFGGLSVSDFSYLNVNPHNTFLVSGGPLAAYFFDGKKWKTLINILD